jgi:hypothetical protein
MFNVLAVKLAVNQRTGPRVCYALMFPKGDPYGDALPDAPYTVWTPAKSTGLTLRTRHPESRRRNEAQLDPFPQLSRRVSWNQASWLFREAVIEFVCATSSPASPASPRDSNRRAAAGRLISVMSISPSKIRPEAHAALLARHSRS